MSGRRIADLATHDEAFISVQQFATYLGVDYRTVRNKWIKAGALPAYTFEGVWRIKRSDAMAFVERHRLNGCSVLDPPLTSMPVHPRKVT